MALTLGFLTLKWPILWHILTCGKREKVNFSIQNHRENSALRIENVLKVLFDVKAILGFKFGVSLLLLDPNPGNVGKEPFYTVKTALFRQN